MWKSRELSRRLPGTFLQRQITTCSCLTYLGLPFLGCARSSVRIWCACSAISWKDAGPGEVHKAVQRALAKGLLGWQRAIGTRPIAGVMLVGLTNLEASCHCCPASCVRSCHRSHNVLRQPCRDHADVNFNDIDVYQIAVLHAYTLGKGLQVGAEQRLHRIHPCFSYDTDQCKRLTVRTVAQDYCCI